MAHVTLNTAEITSWERFHDVCTKIFGFPDFYGRTMNAWIDCLTYLREGDGMSGFILEPGEYLHIHLLDYEAFSGREPEICQALLECVAFVNTRYQSPCLSLILE
ncbi:barstar family protein [Deinococcus sp.]|uniref:barstar family protein n=1 Tax=Deinococcus sp. TaxID=47478 RepID=UPI003CC600E5